MSRDFNGSSQYASRVGIPIAGYPYTVAGWMRLDAAPGTGLYATVLSLNDGFNSVTGALSIELDENRSLGGWVDAGGWDGANPTTISTGQWIHVAMVCASATSRRFFVDAVGGNGSTASAPFSSAIDTVYIGAWNNGFNFLDGQLAHWAVWNSALSDADVALLAGGDNPLAVQAASLQAYWPLAGTASPEPDDKNDYDLTLTGSPPQGGSSPTVDPPPGAATSFLMFNPRLPAAFLAR